MRTRRSRAGVALIVAGALILFVGVVAQLAVTDGAAEVGWVVVGVLGVAVGIAGIVVLAREQRRLGPPED